MTKQKFKQTPIKGVKSTALKSRRLARVVTGAYHEIQNEVEQIRRRASSGSGALTGDARRLVELDEAMQQNGGVDLYQKASIISTEHFKTSKWVIKSLQEPPLLRKPQGKGKKLSTLEVGAINIQLQQCPWLKVRAIDLNSQHRLIEEQDMLLLPESTFGVYDVVLSSMVINCVSCPYKRFEMLVRLSLHIKPDGVLFIILPTRCVQSMLMGDVHFTSILHALGLVDACERRQTPKLTFFTLVKQTTDSVDGKESKKSGLEKKDNNSLSLSVTVANCVAKLPVATKKVLANNEKIWSASPSIFCMSVTPPPNTSSQHVVSCNSVNSSKIKKKKAKNRN